MEEYEFRDRDWRYNVNPYLDVKWKISSFTRSRVNFNRISIYMPNLYSLKSVTLSVHCLSVTQ